MASPTAQGDSQPTKIVDPAVSKMVNPAAPVQSPTDSFLSPCTERLMGNRKNFPKSNFLRRLLDKGAARQEIVVKTPVKPVDPSAKGDNKENVD